MNKLKLMTVVGTRPEIIKMSAIMRKSDLYFDHVLVHTGQNYDYALNELFFRDLGLRAPDYYLGAAGNNPGRTIGNVIAETYSLMAEIKPDALIVLGDTNSCLCVISAKRLKIPIFHMEAGNRCFDDNLPEEINRRIVDITSDVNLCYTEHARRYILSCGVRPEHTFVVGSPMAEVLRDWKAEINNSGILKTLGIESGRYILLSAHREENIDGEEHFLNLMNAVNAIAEKYAMPVIYSVHPRSRRAIEKRRFKFSPLVRALEPFGFYDYNHLQQHAFCVMSDSGTLSEEAAYLGFPAISLRTSTERPEGLDKGVFTIGGTTPEEVLRAAALAVAMQQNADNGLTVPDYADENVSAKVVKLIQSYTGIVNRFVWRKSL